MSQEVKDRDYFTAKRRVPRRKYFEKVGVLVGGRYSVEQAFEIGERGMLISSMVDLNEGDRVVVTFHIPEVLFALARGQVRYEIDANSSDNKVNKYGIEFVDVDFNTRRLIRYYVASKTNLFKETEAD